MSIHNQVDANTHPQIPIAQVPYPQPSVCIARHTSSKFYSFCFSLQSTIGRLSISSHQIYNSNLIPSTPHLNVNIYIQAYLIHKRRVFSLPTCGLQLLQNTCGERVYVAVRLDCQKRSCSPSTIASDSLLPPSHSFSSHFHAFLACFARTFSALPAKMNAR
jgi:hypothetical protein